MKRIMGILAVMFLLAGFLTVSFAEEANTSAIDTAKPAVQTTRQAGTKHRRAAAQKHKAVKRQAKAMKKEQVTATTGGVAK